MNQTFDTIATTDVTTRAVAALSMNGFLPEVVATGADAFARIKELIPAGVSVMNGASETLKQIGYIEYLTSGAHQWVNPKDAILKEEDKEKQDALRKQSVVSDWYLGSAHAVTESGELMFASNSGSQLPHLVYTSPNIVLVVSTQKIVPNIAAGFERIDAHIVPLEDVRMMEAYKIHTTHAKTVILHEENPMMGRKVHVIFVKEKLGF
ncbi:MAG: lactate utilization protein [Parcubacteria group bacterium]|nr:lactate utilization protein [Parcubacteria group bacterium]